MSLISVLDVLLVAAAFVFIYVMFGRVVPTVLQILRGGREDEEEVKVVSQPPKRPPIRRNEVLMFLAVLGLIALLLLVRR